MMWQADQMKTGEQSDIPPFARDWYTVLITEASVLVPKSGNGRMLFVKGAIMSGESSGRTLMTWTIFERTPMEDWVTRNQSLIGALLVAAGVQNMDPNDASSVMQLENKTIGIKAAVKDGNTNFYDFRPPAVAPYQQQQAAQMNGAAQMQALHGQAQQPAPIHDDDIPF